MIRSSRALATEIEAALGRLDAPALEREYWAQDEFLFVPRFLPPGAVGALLEDVRRLEPDLNRNYIPRHKKGGSVSHYAIAADGPALLALYRSERFRRFLSGVVRADLKLCPDEDPHGCALYFYTEPGDHMGYHYDTSYYRGARYTALLGLVQDSSSQLQCRLHTRTPGRAPVDLAVATEPGSLVLFNGDKVYHGVSPSPEGGRRVVYTMEFVTSQEMGHVQRIYSNLKDAVAYFGIRALLRGRSRARDLAARAQAES